MDMGTPDKSRSEPKASIAAVQKRTDVRDESLRPRNII